MTKKHVSLLVVFVLLFTTLFSSFVFAADDEWVVADEITINVKSHIQSYGDKDFTGKGEVAFGTYGEAKRLERFNITLEGAPADMELVGMAHVQSFGDMPATGFKAGEVGTSGLAKRIEGVAFKLVKKGTDTLYPGYQIAYAVHMQSFGWGVSDKVNEVIAKNFDGAEDFAVDGAFAGTKGLSKRIESVSMFIYKEAKLAVKGVSALNLKQVAVEFNGASLLDKDQAVKVANYALEDADENEIELAGAELDGNKVVLTIKDGDEVKNQSDAVLTVKKALLGEDKEFDVEFVDLTIPKAIGAKVIGEDTVKITFSEPIDVVTKDDFEIDGGDYFIKDIVKVKNDTEVNVTAYSSFDEGTIKVEISNDIEDYAGLNVLSKTFEVEVPDDDAAPVVVGYKNASRNSVTLIFDEDIQLTNEADVDSFYHTNSSNVVDDKENGDPNVTVNGAELKLNFTDAPLPEGTAYVYIQGKVVSDLFGNVEKNVIRTKIEVTIDTTKPEIKEVKATNQETIKVTFTEPVEYGAENEDNYTVLDPDGDEVEEIIDLATKASDVVTLNLNDELDYGKYTLVVEGIEDVSGNKMAKASVAFEVKDTTPPDFPETATLYQIGTGNNYKLVVKYDESMAISGSYSVLNLDNYILDDGSDEILLSDIDDTTIKAVDKNKTVEINFKDYTVDATMELIIARVADAAGNKSGLKSGSIDIVDGASQKIGFKADGVVATATDKIKVAFDDDFVNFDGKDLKVYYTTGSAIKVDGAVTNEIAISRVRVLSTSEVELTLSKKLNSDASYKASDVLTKEDVFVVVVGEASKNKYGVSLNETDLAEVEDKIAPEVAVDGIEFVTATSIEITFTEDLDEDTFASTGKNGFSVKGGTLESVEVAGNVVTLKGKDFTKNTDVLYNGTNGIADAEGNSLKAFTRTTELKFTE